MSDGMQVTVLFFATIKEKAGSRQAQLALPDGTSVGGFKTLLGVQFPALKDSLKTALVAVNREFAFDEDLLTDGAEVALFPPVSGGTQ